MDAKQKFFGMASKPDTPKVGVGVILVRTVEFPSFGNQPEIHRPEVLLGLRRKSHGDGEWSLPGGHMELGERFMDTCKREVLEETGMEIAGIVPLCFTNDIFEKDGLHYVTLFFGALWNSDQVPRVMEDKTETWGFFSMDKLPSPLFPPLRRALNFDHSMDDGLEPVSPIADWIMAG